MVAEGKPQCASTFYVPACTTFANVLWAKASHTAKPKCRNGKIDLIV